MRADEWDDAKQLFADALPMSALERERLLSAACAGRERVRAEVESLLEAHERAFAFLATGATAGDPTGPEALLIGQRLGPYRLEALLGQGGMGVVYRARREAPDREVALKVVRLGPGQAGLVRRFELESRALARLDHPNIARLYDVGRTPDGRPYFALELVAGQALDRHCAERRLPLRARLELFSKLCEAVAYAHGRLVVHRDLKPGNVLVTADGSPKLLDFGIAQLLDENVSERLTESGLLLVTPSYASPEQMRGEPATVATDVHALGLLLHLLLTGRGAFRLRSGAPDELVRVVCLDDTPAPSADLARAPSGSDRFRPPEPWPRLARLLRGDLDSIVARALRKEPQARYASVADLQADVRRYLEGEPVSARDGRLRYRAGKFVRRHRLPVGLLAGLLLALIGGLGTTLWQARVARIERARAERRFADVRRLATSFLFDFHDAIRDLPGSTRARELVVSKALEYLEGLSHESGDDSALRFELARAYQRVGTVQGVGGQANLGDATGAARSLERAWDLLRQAEPQLRGQPDFVLAQVEIATLLGRTRTELGQFDTLVPLLQAADQQAGAAPADTASLQFFKARIRLLLDLTVEQQRRGDLNRSEQAASQALEVALGMCARWPEDSSARAVLGSVQRNLASLQIHLGRYAEARTNALAAVFVQRASLEPGNATSSRSLMHALTGLGKVERDGDIARSEAAYAEALQISEGLAAQDPANSNAVTDTWGVLANWCLVLDRAQQRPKARDVCGEALRLAERTAEESNAAAAMRLVASRYFAGWQREIQGDAAAALRLYERALRASGLPVLAQGPELRAVEAEIWSATARARLELGQADAAGEAARQALGRLGPLTDQARPDPEGLETRLLATIVLARASLALVAADSTAAACAPLEAATAVAGDLRALTSGLPRQRPVLAQFQALQAHCASLASAASP